MTLNQLLYFYKAAELEHFNLAADHLHISEPSLSRSIRSLEQELGVSLFEKRGRNITLTKAGQIFLEHAELILNDINQAQRKMHELATDGGHINIGYVAPLAREFLPKLVRNFSIHDENKNVVFDFFEGYTDQLIDGLKKRKYDLIFCSYEEHEDDIEFVSVIQQEMVVIVAKGHPLANKDVIDFEDFCKYPVLTYDRTSGLGKESRDYFNQHSQKAKISYGFPDEASIASFVAENFGIALVADVHEIHRDDIVIKKLSEKEAFSHNCYMGYLRGVYQLPAITRLIQFIITSTH